MSQISSNISIDIGSASYSSPNEISSILDSLINDGRFELSSYLSPFYVPLRYSDGKSPSSNCANVIISLVCSCEDVPYGMYNTSGHISIASEYGYGMYAKAQEKLSQKRHRTKIQYFICAVHKQDTLFDAVEFKRIYLKNLLNLGYTCLMPLSQHVQ